MNFEKGFESVRRVSSNESSEVDKVSFIRKAIEGATLAGSVRFPEIPMSEGLEEVLSDLGVSPFPDNDVLIVSRWDNIGVLYKLGLIEFNDGEDTDHPVRKGLIRLAFPDGLNKDAVYQFPARLVKTFPTYTKVDKALKDSAAKKFKVGTSDEEEIPDMVDELSDINDSWASGASSEEVQRLHDYTRIPKLTLFKSDYSWDRGKLYKNTSGEMKVEISIAEQHDLLARAKEGDGRAREELVKIHLGLVLSVVEAVQELFGGEGDDMVQAGLEGLMVAIDRFDPSKEFKFSTYARNWIESKIRYQHKHTKRIIRIPDYVYSKISQYHNAYDILEKKFGRVPAISEIASALNVTDDEVRKLEIQTSIKGSIVGFAESPDVVQDGQVVPESHTEVYEPADQALIRQQLVSHMDEMLNTLTSREMKVIKMSFFSDEGEGLDEQEIAKVFDVTPVRIRQIKAKALRRLSHPSRSDHMGIFLDD